MLSLNKRAIQIFAKLTEGLNEVGDHKTIDNTDGAFMTVHVEIIGKPNWPNLRPECKIVSIAHYFRQNGDTCCDPDMTFLVGKDAVYAMTFEQQGGLPIYQVAMKFEDGKLLTNEKLQQQLTLFACEWMTNINEQQSLGI